MLVPKRLADFGDPATAASTVRAVVDQPHFLAAVHLEGVEAVRLQACDAGDDVGRAVAADPAIDLHAVAHQAAEQFVHRHAQGLALDVPQRLVDAGDGAHQDRAAAIEAAAVHASASGRRCAPGPCRSDTRTVRRTAASTVRRGPR